MSPLDKAHRAYENDPLYHAFVTHLEVMIEKLEMSPSEIREAAMYACYRVEARRPIIVRQGESLEAFLRRR